MNYLPATTYVAPPRLGRGRPLKTIVEAEECSFGMRSDSEGDDSDRTIRARPPGLDARLSAASRLSTSTTSSCSISQSPIASSPCSSVGEGSLRGDTYTGSDAGTVFSEDSCPSLAGSNDTTFYTNSSRTSTSSAQSLMSARNKSLSILIPRDSWQGESTIKEITLGMSPARKIMLSPQALSSLSRNLPSISGPPSFGEGSSIASSSPCVPAMSSAPVTPELNNLIPVEGHHWQVSNQEMNTPLEIAVDEHHSFILSPQQAHSVADRTSVGYSTDWSEMVTRFPEVPGGTPQEYTPISPDMTRIKSHLQQEASDNGVQLPMDALQILQHLTRSYSPESESLQSGTSRAKLEMKERCDVGERPQSAIESLPTPSDSDFSQLSIPSPGGFFSSLQASSRATWCFPSQSKTPSMPSSAIAANFYDIPFTRSQDTIQTVLEAPETSLTDGPPTARQANFAIPSEYCADELAEEEDEDMYGALPQLKSSSPESGHEYEDRYQDELIQHAGANIDRTSSWLTAQTTYLSALRETNPMNDPAEYIPQTPHLCQDDNEQQEESPARKAVRFLEDAISQSHGSDGSKKPTRVSRPKDPVFLAAFDYCLAQKGRQDVFLQAAARLERINSTRLALPVQHVHSLLNTYTTETLQVHIRPKYRGPFSQNPRATGNFQRSDELHILAEAERKQLAMDHVQPAVWATEALRKVLYRGQMFSWPSATNYLSRKTEANKKVRILDLAGAATGSWAWTAAQTWPNVNFITVQAKVQHQHASQWPVSAESSKVVKPTNPANHRVLVVAELWKLPFADNHFDIISARTLHMYLHSRPVPEVPSINEWDLVLKECMRVLKPGGVFDYVLLDSHISNNSTDNDSKHSRDHSIDTAASISPTAAYGQGLVSPPITSGFGPTGPVLNPAPLNFGRDLKRRGYDADGGCAKLAERLEASGFESHRSQWVGLPVGRTGPTHDNVTASYERFETRAPTPASTNSKATSALQRSKVGSVNHANGRSRTPFPPAPRPISEVSTISRIIEQYSNVEAVQGPVGSTADVSDLAGLLGTMMWEEWLVRHRLEILECKKRQKNDSRESVDVNFEAMSLLHGINDVLAAGHAKGACFRTVVGWARKPGTKPKTKKAVPTPALSQQQPEVQVQGSLSRGSAIRIDTDVASLPNPETYRARAQQRAYQNPSYQGYPSGETPVTAINMAPQPKAHYSRGFNTPVDFRRQDLTLDIRTPEGQSISPQYTQSAVDRGEVGIIPMMIIE